MSNILKENKKSMKEYKNERQSNFELLRIIAMIMIVAHHLTIHCFAVQLGDKSLYALVSSSLSFFKKKNGENLISI